MYLYILKHIYNYNIIKIFLKKGARPMGRPVRAWARPFKPVKKRARMMELIPCSGPRLACKVAGSDPILHLYPQATK